MKINSKVLSIPPIISTSWDNVSSLHMDESNSQLIIILKSGNKVTITNLPGPVIQEIFAAHIEFLEQNRNGNEIPNITVAPMGGVGMENFQGMMQHDPSQKDSPPLPEEILSKITTVAKTLGLDFSMLNLPEGEPHCNCPYCQVARSMNVGQEKPREPINTPEEEQVTDADLSFREWDIKQIGEKLFQISNPLIPTEQYQVYLGTPIGCTCGRNNCEHIIAALNS